MPMFINARTYLLFFTNVLKAFDFPLPANAERVSQLVNACNPVRDSRKSCRQVFSDLISHRLNIYNSALGTSACFHLCSIQCVVVTQYENKEISTVGMNYAWSLNMLRMKDHLRVSLLIITLQFRNSFNSCRS